MRSPAVVHAFDVIKDIQTQFFHRVIGTPVCPLLLQELEEALTAGIIVRIAFLGERLHDIAGIQELAEGEGSIFRALIAVEDQTVFDIPVCKGFPECGLGQFNIMP